MSKVYFYLNEGDYNRVKHLTAVEDFTLRHPQLVWSWGTYFRLKNRGHDVKLTCTIPENGILVMPAIYPAMTQKPPAGVLIICTVADSPPLFYMPVNVTQNPLQPQQYRNLLYWPVWRHISHWPQPGIIPRAKERDGRFERIAFFGHRDQLESQLASADFQQKLNKMELLFEIRESDFTDYSDVDAIIAIRGFSNEPFLHKPYTKLVNGWLAETPVIAGTETSFSAIKKSELDYITVSSTDELVNALLRLKADAGLRKQMAENGRRRAAEFNEESVIRQWEQLLFTDAPAYLLKWEKTNRFEKQLFYLDLFLSRSFRSAKNKIINRLHRATGNGRAQRHTSASLQKSETLSTLAPQNP